MDLIPSDCMTSDEYIEEILGELEWANDIIDMLQDRLDDAEEESCICAACLKNYKEFVKGELEQ